MTKLKEFERRLRDYYGKHIFPAKNKALPELHNEALRLAREIWGEESIWTSAEKARKTLATNNLLNEDEVFEDKPPKPSTKVERLELIPYTNPTPEPYSYLMKKINEALFAINRMNGWEE